MKRQLMVAAVMATVFLGLRVARADFCGGDGPPQPPCDPTQECCNPPGAPPQPPQVEDPVDISGGNTVYAVTDISLPTSFGPLQFVRTYTSQAQSAPFSITVSDVNSPPTFPFGSGEARTTARWSHNFRAVVSFSSPYAYVQDNRGQVDNFTCGTGPGFCTGSVYASRNRLERTSTGFVYYQDGRGKLVFDKKWQDTVYDVYYLTEVHGLAHRLAVVNYAQPSDPSCRVAPAGSDPGLPFVSSVVSDEGTSLSFAYTPIISWGLTDCVIASVSILPSGADAGSPVPVVAYGYYPPSPYIYPHLQSATVLGAGGGGTDYIEQYLYSGTYQQSAVQIQRSSGVILGHLDPAQTGWVNTIVQPAGRVALDFYPPPVTGMQHPRTLTYLDSQPGDGTLGPVDAGVLQRTYDVAPTPGVGAVVTTVVDSCAPGAACSPGTQSSVFTPNAGNIHIYEQGKLDKRGSWSVGLREPAPAGQSVSLSELRQSIRGATDYDGGQALETTTYSYLYATKGEQQLQSSFKDTVLGPGGNKTETQRSYDATTNRLTKVIQHGWTSSFSGSAWTTTERYVGTFYFTNHACLADGADPLGRTVEIHGPCLVSGFSAADCDASGAVPISQSFYYPLTDPAPRGGKLQKTVRFTNTTAGSCASAKSLTTTYSVYDVRGNPTSVSDPNGVVTTLAYEEDRVTSSTTSGQTTTYTYDTRKLAAVGYPQGNYDVFCYRSGTPGAGCTGGTWTAQLQWKAKSALADGSTWSEKVVYTYWSDGTVATETYRGACTSGCTAVSGEIRRVVKHAADAHRRPTWDQSGDATGSFTSTRFFDRADNLAGIGFSYNSPPAFCGGAAGTSGTAADTPISTLCSALAYDRANRLIGLDEYPTSSGGATRSCLAYDAQGNVASVRTGCSASGSPGDCSSCTAPASTYQYDDFGNVTAATLPWTDNGSGAAGTTRYTYDAAGHLLQKQTPAMAQTGDYLTYASDSLSRTLSLTHHYTQPSSGDELLFTFAYDNAATLDASCPQPSNTKGRLLYRNDSFGATWFRYDAFGRVLQEVRLRAGTTTCSASTPNLNPHTTYTYSNNGNVTSVTYPYGRKVTYGYGSGALADRVSNVSVTSWNGTAWVTQSNLISAVAWEPYGGLRGYQIKHPTTATTSAVEYLLGDNGSAMPTSGCPTTVPSTGSSDHTGRVRALWVSTGNFSPGIGNGATYKRTYTWQGDQLKQEDTCLLGATTASTVTYGYDQLLRLTSAGRPGGNFGAAGGSIGSRTYGLDGRGNRTSETREDCSYPATYGQSSFPDRLTRQASACTGAILKYDYAYDRDGRVASKKWPVDSTGDAGTTMLFASGGNASGTNGALDTVFKSVSVNGAVYNYYYDALNRRRLKVYPAGPQDEAFHDTANQLLVDQGNDAVLSPTVFPVDEYVWLGGRPVMLVRSKLSTSWTRQTDSTGDCTRNGDAAACGFYFPVTDVIGKPVVMLDASRRVSGAAEYDVFGFPNRVSLDKETAHPYANNSNLTLADFTQTIGGTANPSTQVRLRAIFDLVDTEGPVATPADYVFLKDPDGGVALTSNIGGPHRGQVWSPWVVPSAGRIQVPFVSNATGSTYTGVVMAGYEYQRFQTGAQPFWTPLGFPGQYHDGETDLFQNWNRFYESSSGRYLEPEPLLLLRPQAPMTQPRELSQKALELTAQSIQDFSPSPPVYSYAGNNPLGYDDPNGFATAGAFMVNPFSPGCYQHCYDKKLEAEAQRGGRCSLTLWASMYKVIDKTMFIPPSKRFEYVGCMCGGECGLIPGCYTWALVWFDFVEGVQ